MQCQCSRENPSSAGLAVIVLTDNAEENWLSKSLCCLLDTPTLSNVCVFDFSQLSGKLCECLAKHKAVVLLDLTCYGIASGTVSIADVRALLSRNRSVSNAKIAKELADSKNGLPERIMLICIEPPLKGSATPDSTAAGDNNLVAEKICTLISSILQTLKHGITYAA